MTVLHHIRCHPQDLKLYIEEVKHLGNDPRMDVRPDHKVHFKLNNLSSGTATINVYKVKADGTLEGPTDELFGAGGGSFSLTSNSAWIEKTVQDGAAGKTYRIKEARSSPAASEGKHAPLEGMTGTVVVGPKQP
jgi:hypothetical protein